MELNNIVDSEILYRMVKKSDPDGFINGKPTAALFMDANGVSVDRDGGRVEADIIENFKKRFRKRDDYRTAVKIKAGVCRDVDTFPKPIGNHKNRFHAEIWNSQNEKLVSLFKAVKLAKMCNEVKE